MSIASRWRAFWFPAVPVRRLAAFRIIISAFCLYDIVVGSAYVADLASADRAFYRPILLLRVLEVPAPTPEAMAVVRVVLAVALACALVGLATRIALPVAATLYVWWFATLFSYGAIGHGRSTVIFALVAMSLAPAGRAYSLDALVSRVRRARADGPLPALVDEHDPIAGWALRVVTLMLVSAYLLAAYAKLRTAGIAWPVEGQLEAALIEKGTPVGLALINHLWLVHAMAAVTLIWEVTAWVVFFGGRIRDLWFLNGLLFHLGSVVLLDIDFLSWVFTYAAFYNLEVGTARVGAGVRRLGARRGPPIEVIYDGGCGLCRKSATLIAGLDWLGRLRLVDGALGSESLDAFYAVDGRARHRGYDAYRRIARAVPAFWPLLPLSYLPGVARIGNAVYEHVAAARSTSASCSVDECAPGPPDRRPIAS